jgi:hypothetical protein
MSITRSDFLCSEASHDAEQLTSEMLALLKTHQNAQSLVVDSGLFLFVAQKPT